MKGGSSGSKSVTRLPRRDLPNSAKSPIRKTSSKVVTRAARLRLGSAVAGTGVARHGVLAPPPAGPGSLPALKEVQIPSSYTYPLPSRAPAPCGSPTSPVPASAVGIALDLHRRHPLHFGGVLPREFDGLQDLHLPVHPVRLGGGARAHPAAQAWPRARGRPGPRARVLRGSALLLRWTWLQGSGGSGRVTPGPGPDTLISCPARARCAAT